MIIRRQHECTHYPTSPLLSSMRSHLADELIADYCGIVAARKAYSAPTGSCASWGSKTFPHTAAAESWKTIGEIHP